MFLYLISAVVFINSFLDQDCNLSGPEVCRTEYVSECWTKNDPHTVVDDVPKCRTEYEEKCENIQVFEKFVSLKFSYKCRVVM